MSRGDAKARSRSIQLSSVLIFINQLNPRDSTYLNLNQHSQCPKQLHASQLHISNSSKAKPFEL